LRLKVPGDIATAEMIDTDNDGTWSNYYMASQAFRFGATGMRRRAEMPGKHSKLSNALKALTRWAASQAELSNASDSKSRIRTDGTRSGWCVGLESPHFER
jgi:hypothetical protein